MNWTLFAIAQAVASHENAVIPNEAFTLPITDHFDQALIDYLTEIEYASPEAMHAARVGLGELIACAMLAGPLHSARMVA